MTASNPPFAAAVSTQVFNTRQFEPKTELDWQPVLLQWLSGSPLGTLPYDRVEIAQFIESDLTYLLVWGIEASRVYETAQGNLRAFDLTGTVVTATETGTLSLPASIQIKSGFDHRSAALTAVTETIADFDTAWGMRLWIEDLPLDLRDSSEWPSVESRSAWLNFTNRASSTSRGLYRSEGASRRGVMVRRAPRIGRLVADRTCRCRQDRDPVPGFPPAR